MIVSITLAASALVLTQAPPADATSPPPAASAPVITELAQLPLEAATAARCGVAFAAVQQWQGAGDPRGAPWPDLQATGAREFFVQAMAQIMAEHTLGREDVARLVQREFEGHVADEGAAIAAMMPGCLLVLEAAKL